MLKKECRDILTLFFPNLMDKKWHQNLQNELFFKLSSSFSPQRIHGVMTTFVRDS